MADGNYITYQQIEDRLTETLLEKITCLADAACIAHVEAEIIPRAESRVDGALVVRYTIPVPENDLCTEWALNIAEYEIYRRGHGPKVPDKVRQAYEDTIKDLDKVVSGKLAIPSATTPTATDRAGELTVDSNDAVFDSVNFVGW